MALNASTLTAALKAAFLGLPVNPSDPGGQTWDDVMSDDQKDKMEASISAQMTEVINHIVENAEIYVAMENHTHSGVTTGTGISGPPVPGFEEIGQIDVSTINPVSEGGTSGETTGGSI